MCKLCLDTGTVNKYAISFYILLDSHVNERMSSKQFYKANIVHRKAFQWGSHKLA